MWVNFVAVLIGGLVTIGTAVLIEYLRSPRLQFRLCSPTDHEYSQNHPAMKVRFVHLSVENRTLPRCLKWMLRAAATECCGIVTFHHLDGQKVFDRSMEIRWGSTPEPAPLEVAFGEQRATVFDPNVWRMQRVDIIPGESQVLNVAARFDDDEECYGWNNEAYFSKPQWRNPKYRLPRDRYLVKVVVVSSGRKCSGTFRLNNDMPIGDFRIEKAQPSDVARD